MPTRRLIFILVAFFIGLPLLGYLWPQAANVAGPVAERHWQWPNSDLQKEIEPQPKLLARFWPIPAPTAAKVAVEPNSKSKPSTLQLVAIVGQHGQYQALVLTPAGKLKTLNKGDALDAQRSISAISASTVRWQQHLPKTETEPTSGQPASSKAPSPPTQGELVLFPRPGASQSLPAMSTVESTPESAVNPIAETIHE